ncbi:ER-golgi trafficking TRAPP I complex 85 kDa subunit-domain-containing protein, partial [Ochromonadaceae sp. CCMP2298]
LPASPSELRSNPPSGWTRPMEQIVGRLLSFSEFEMTSHPCIILTVVATSDVDHILAMQELASAVHTPVCLSNGQYDPSLVTRMYVLLHDASDSINPQPILHMLQQRFGAANTKLIVINSFPQDSPNLQQPDMWSRFLAPRFFPHQIPSHPNLSQANLPRNPLTQEAVLGAHLSMDDFMSLRNFCVDVFNQGICTVLERRLVFLHKQVNDNRKGVKNVLKSFWRKPREEDVRGAGGGLKYRFDKIESQTQLLADTCFVVKDYEGALGLYKLVREDFKSDKCLLHLAHALLMMGACHVLLEPTRVKDLHADLETLGQVLVANTDQPYLNAYFALLAAELYVANFSTRAPLEAAMLLLVAARNMIQTPLLSGLLVEKSAAYFLQAGQARKYVFYSVVAGNKLLRCGMTSTARHAAVCFAAAMVVVDEGQWGDLKAKLSRSLAVDIKALGCSGAQRSLLLMLKMLSAFMHTPDSHNEAVQVFPEVTGEGGWGFIRVSGQWRDLSTRQILLDPLPVTDLDPSELPGGSAASHVEVNDLLLPELNVGAAVLLNSLCGVEAEAESCELTRAELVLAEDMHRYLELERRWVEGTGVEKLTDCWAELEAEMLRGRGKRSVEIEAVRVPLGEAVNLRVQMCNKLPLDLHLTRVQVVVEPAGQFDTQESELTLPQDMLCDVVLSTRPKSLGRFRIEAARWNLSEQFSVRQSLQKSGPLLQRTRAQRAERERGEDASLCFEVVEAHPLLRIAFEGLSPEVLQGQLLKSTLVLRNDGAATACDIFIKLSQPLFVFGQSQVIRNDVVEESGGGLIRTCGESCTVLRLAEGTSIPPGEALRFEAWLMVSQTGLQKISLLASYKALRADGSKQAFGPGPRCRTSFVSIQTNVLPSLGMALRLVPKPSSCVHYTLIAELINYLRDEGKEVTNRATLGGPVSPLVGSMSGGGGEGGVVSPGSIGSPGSGSRGPRLSGSPLRERLSSVGQLDLPDLQAQEMIEIDESCLKVVGLWVLGAGAPFKYKTPTRWEDPQRPSLLVSPAERIACCFPVKYVLPQARGGQGGLEDQGKQGCVSVSPTPRGRCSWLLQMSGDIEGKAASTTSATSTPTSGSPLNLVSVVERFLCVGNDSARFDREIEASRLLVQAAERDAETNGPRSIAQVRRGKTERVGVAGGGGQLSLGLSLPDLTAKMAEVQLSGPAGVESGERSGKSGVEVGVQGAPTNAQGLAELAAAKHGLVVAAVWACRWEGKLRWGMHKISNLSFVGEGVCYVGGDGTGGGGAGRVRGATSPSKGVPTLKPAADYLLVGLVHAGHSSPGARVPVRVQLRSLSDRPLSVTIAALDGSAEAPRVRTDFIYGDGPDGRIEKVATGGLTWSGKTQHIGLALPPGVQREVQFDAVLGSGTFDLNRFRISVRFSNGTTLTAKHVVGQALIHVS